MTLRTSTDIGFSIVNYLARVAGERFSLEGVLFSVQNNISDVFLVEMRKPAKRCHIPSFLREILQRLFQVGVM